MATSTICDVCESNKVDTRTPATWIVSLRCKEITGSTIFSVASLDSCHAHVAECVHRLLEKMDDPKTIHSKDSPKRTHGIGEWLGIEARLL